MKLRRDPNVTRDPAKKRAVEELVAAEAKRLTQPQLQEVFQDLSRGMKYLCNNMRTLSPNEKAEMQKRFKQNPPYDPADVVEEANRLREEQKEAAAKTVGPFQIQPPEEEMARIVLVQCQLEDVRKFDDEKTQKTLVQEAAAVDVSFRSILQPSVMEKYEQSLTRSGNTQAVSVLQSMSQVGAMDDRQLGKKVDQLLTTMHIDRQKLRNVLQQMVKDRLMTNDEAKDVERRCELLMASGGGKMKLSDLQSMMKGKQRAR